MNNDWKLKKLEISYTICHHKIKNDEGYDEWVGGYKGNISFNNTENESFSANISESQMHRIIDIIRETIINNAETMAEKIKKSLGDK